MAHALHLCAFSRNRIETPIPRRTITESPWVERPSQFALPFGSLLAILVGCALVLHERFSERFEREVRAIYLCIALRVDSRAIAYEPRTKTAAILWAASASMIPPVLYTPFNQEPDDESWPTPILILDGGVPQITAVAGRDHHRPPLPECGPGSL